MGISVQPMLTAGVCGDRRCDRPGTVRRAAPGVVRPGVQLHAHSLGSADPHQDHARDHARRRRLHRVDRAVAHRRIVEHHRAGHHRIHCPPSAAVDDDGQIEVQNVASDVIDSVYRSPGTGRTTSRPLDLGPWLINWVPFGYLVSDQINIWYNAFVLPVVDSFVYKFLDPIVNDPLNLGVWWNGAVAIADAALRAWAQALPARSPRVLARLAAVPAAPAAGWRRSRHRHRRPGAADVPGGGVG